MDDGESEKKLKSNLNNPEEGQGDKQLRSNSAKSEELETEKTLESNLATTEEAVAPVKEPVEVVPEKSKVRKR